MAIDPIAGTELATRYAAAKVYSTEAVARLWPEAQRRLLEDGRLAQVDDLAADARDDGYAFGAKRAAKRPAPMQKASRQADPARP